MAAPLLVVVLPRVGIHDAKDVQPHPGPVHLPLHPADADWAPEDVPAVLDLIDEVDAEVGALWDTVGA